MSEDAVKQFEAYNFNEDDKWLQYWTNISDALTNAQKHTYLLKYKIKYFKSNINALFPENYKPWTSPYELVLVKPKSTHKATVIFLHGLGDSGYGWSDTFENIQKQLSPSFDHVKFICPSALAQAVTLNMGFVMPAWYDIKGLSASAEEDEEGIKKTAAQITLLIENEIKQGIPSDKIILGGFSQGGSIALYVGLTFGKPLAGILGMSTYASLRNTLPSLISEANLKTPLLMCHGNVDQVVRFEFGQLSYYAIKQLRDERTKGQHKSELKTYPTLAHSANPQELRDVAKWMQELI